jgi:small-conductance mechanosensitive channel
MNSIQVPIWFVPVQRFMHWKIGAIAVEPLLIAAGIAALTFVILLWLRHALKLYLGRWAARTSSDLDDLVVELIGSTNGFVLLVMGLYAGSLTVALKPRWAVIAGTVAAIAVLLQLGLWGNRVIGYAIRRIINRHAHEDAGLANAAGAVSFLSRVALWSLVALLILSSLQINITALIAGLGVGGVAVALAVQNILGDLFASLSILIDKPFAVGHFIVVDDLSGTVEHVGVKSTRLRSLSGEEVVLSNGELLKCRIHNYKKLYERRILFGFGVTYDVPYEKLVAIPAVLREIIERIPRTRFDRAHFKEFGDSSLNFEVVYFVLDPEYNVYMDIQQQINLAMVKRFAQDGIEFAFPTRTLHLVGLASASNAKEHRRGDGNAGQMPLFAMTTTRTD